MVTVARAAHVGASDSQGGAGGQGHGDGGIGALLGVGAAVGGFGALELAVDEGLEHGLPDRAAVAGEGLAALGHAVVVVPARSRPPRARAVRPGPRASRRWRSRNRVGRVDGVIEGALRPGRSARSPARRTGRRWSSVRADASRSACSVERRPSAAARAVFGRLAPSAWPAPPAGGRCRCEDFVWRAAQSPIEASPSRVTPPRRSCSPTARSAMAWRRSASRNSCPAATATASGSDAVQSTAPHSSSSTRVRSSNPATNIRTNVPTGTDTTIVLQPPRTLPTGKRFASCETNLARPWPGRRVTRRPGNMSLRSSRVCCPTRGAVGNAGDRINFLYGRGTEGVWYAGPA